MAGCSWTLDSNSGHLDLLPESSLTLNQIPEMPRKFTNLNSGSKEKSDQKHVSGLQKSKEAKLPQPLLLDKD